MERRRINKIILSIAIPIVFFGILFVCTKASLKPKKDIVVSVTPTMFAFSLSSAPDANTIIQTTQQPTLIVTATPSPVVTVSPTPVVTVSPTPVVTVGPTPVVTATPVPVVTITPVPTPTGGDALPTVTPTPTASVPTDIPAFSLQIFNFAYYEEPKAGIIQTAFYIRKEPGRTSQRVVNLPVGTRIEILSICTNVFNEPWYGVRAAIGGNTYEGYIQASAAQLGTVLAKKPTAEGLIAEPIVKNPTGTLGPDRDGDGIYVVVLDAGHGGRDPGACAFGAEEKTLNLKVAQYCKAYLESTYSNVKVMMTRAGDYQFDSFDSNDDLEYRVRAAMEYQADMMLCMHFNAYDGKQRGSMALIPRQPAIMEKDRLLASYVLEELTKLGIPMVGIRRKESPVTMYLDGRPMDGYLILRLSGEVGIPCTIIEHCYIDSSVDRQFWNTEEKLQKLGEGDARAIARFLNLTVKPAPTPTPESMPEE